MTGAAARLKTYPRAVGTNFANIPAELKQLPQWECWKVVRVDGKDRKVPINALTGQSYPKGLISEEMAALRLSKPENASPAIPHSRGLAGASRKEIPTAGLTSTTAAIRKPATWRVGPTIL